jgi:hypothetical protein
MEAAPTTDIRVVAGAKTRVHPSPQGETLFDVSVLLISHPDDAWVAAFKRAAEAAGMQGVAYRPDDGDAAVGFTEENRGTAIDDTVRAIEQVVERANDLRRQLAEQEQKQQAAQHNRERQAAEIAERLNRQA